MADPYRLLKELGEQLDADIFPRIKVGGIVVPGDPAEPKPTWAEETSDEGQRERRPETRPRPRTTGWQRETNRSGTPSPAPPAICSDLKERYGRELTAVQEAYPGAQVLHQEEGLWLITESALLPGLWQKAVILTGIPFTRIRSVRGWGFWMGVPMTYPTWIGPIHTNLPDGSICAFEPTDGTWEEGGSLLTLLDLYTLWTLRHLHLQIFHRWPGRQKAHYVHERLNELKPTEFCGCGSDRLYRDCCRNADLKADRAFEASKFISMGGYQRTPPVAVKAFMQHRAPIPQIADVLPFR